MKKLVLLLIIVLTADAFAQQPHALTDTEQQQWAQFATADQQLQQRLFATVEQARQLSAANTEQAVRFLAAVKEALSAIEANDLRRSLWLATKQAERDCKGCVVSEDGKSLEKPKAK